MQSNADARRHLPWGRGLLLFRPGIPATVRRRRLIFCALALVIGGALIWPVYPRFATLEPMVLGLPFGIAWVIGALLVMFVGLAWLYRGDRDLGAGLEEEIEAEER